MNVAFPIYIRYVSAVRSAPLTLIDNVIPESHPQLTGVCGEIHYGRHGMLQ